MELRSRKGVSTYLEVFILISVTIAGTALVAFAMLPYESVAQGASIAIPNASIRQGSNVAIEKVLLADTGSVAFSTFTLTTVGISPTASYGVSLQNAATGSSINTPTTGLVGYWRLDEGIGPTTVDASGNGNTGTLGVTIENWKSGIDGWASSGGCANNGGAVTVSVVEAPTYLSNPDSVDIHNSGGTNLGCTTKTISLNAGDVVEVVETGGAAGPADTPACYYSGSTCADTLVYVGSSGSWYVFTLTITTGGSYTLYLYNRAASTATTPTDQYYSVIVKNGPTWASGAGCKFGACLSFASAGSQYVSVPGADLGFASGSSMTIAAWTYPLDESSSHAIFGQSTPGVLFLLSTSGQLCFWANVNNPDVCSSFGSGVATNVWSCTVVTYADSTGSVTFYLNGVSNSQTLTANQMSRATVSYIGSYSGSSYFMNGRVDDVRDYGRALSASEVTTLCSSTTPFGSNPASITLAATTVSPGESLIVTVTIFGTNTFAVGTKYTVIVSASGTLAQQMVVAVPA